MGATLSLVPRALSLALQSQGKAPWGRGWATLSERTKEVYVPRSHTLSLNNLEGLCRSLVIEKTKTVYARSTLRAESHFWFFKEDRRGLFLLAGYALSDPGPNNRSINHFQGKLLLCLYSWKILNIVSTSKTNKERTAERTVFPDNLFWHVLKSCSERTFP